MGFADYKRDLDARADSYVRARKPEPARAVEWRFGLTGEDMVMIAALDKAFIDQPKEEYGN